MQQHILALDGFANTYRSGKGAGQSAKGVTVQGKGKGAGLGAQGGVQKPKPKAQGKPAHAKNQSPLDRQRLAKEKRCFACEEVGHINVILSGALCIPITRLTRDLLECKWTQATLNL